jgi:hypothetical protein
LLLQTVRLGFVIARQPDLLYIVRGVCLHIIGMRVAVAMALLTFVCTVFLIARVAGRVCLLLKKQINSFIAHMAN